jgi:hypothetical protein
MKGILFKQKINMHIKEKFFWNPLKKWLWYGLMKIWPFQVIQNFINFFLLIFFQEFFCIYVSIPLINHTLNTYKISQIKTIQKNACTKKHIKNLKSFFSFGGDEILQDLTIFFLLPSYAEVEAVASESLASPPWVISWGYHPGVRTFIDDETLKDI